MRCMQFPKKHVVKIAQNQAVAFGIQQIIQDPVANNLAAFVVNHVLTHKNRRILCHKRLTMSAKPLPLAIIGSVVDQNNDTIVSSIDLHSPIPHDMVQEVMHSVVFVLKCMLIFL